MFKKMKSSNMDINLVYTSILKQINNLNDEDWNYYQRTESSLKKIDDWNEKEEHKDFINNFLKVSEKMAINTSFKDILSDFKRATHTNSVFFLGCLFYKELNFKDKISFTRDNRDEFHFIWFLTSLIHDFGYKIEKNKSEYPQITEDIETFKEFFSIDEDNDLLKQNTTDYSDNMKTIIEYIPEYYSNRVKGKRSDGTDAETKIDHGIASGLILYSSLIKNRTEMDGNSHLYWGEGLNKFYEEAAFHIAIHNIRMPDNHLKFSINNNAFLFLFLLADTIEPTKCFYRHNPQDILGSITIYFHTNKKGLTIQIKRSKCISYTSIEPSIKSIEKYKKNIMGLKNFLEIEIMENRNPLCYKFVLSWE